MERSRRNGGAIKRKIICAGHIFCIAIDICQATATREGRVADAGHAVWNSDGGQATATREGRATDAGHAAWDCNGGQAAAIIEGTVADAGHVVWNGDGNSPWSTSHNNIVYDNQSITPLFII